MKVLLVEPFFSGSHRQWAEGLAKHSRHEIEILSLPGRHWKWRMYGGAVSLAEKVRDVEKPDLVLCTDMLDVATFQGLTKDVLKGVPVIVYFHENQLTYPWSPEDRDVDLSRDRHYAFTNYTTALAADHIWFNSRYHMTSFLGELPRFLSAFPDEKNLHLVGRLRDKSRVVPLGMDLQPFLAIERDSAPKRPVLLWNHRWEYDKRPEVFFEWCRALKARGTDFGLVVCGQATGKYPSVFDQAKKEFHDHILHWGYADSREAYLECLSMANVLPVSGIQDFFGGSVVEALAAGCRPILPDRLAYPEHIPSALHDVCFYRDPQRVPDLISTKITYDIEDIRSHQEEYDWCRLIKVYDKELQLSAKDPAR